MKDNYDSINITLHLSVDDAALFMKEACKRNLSLEECMMNALAVYIRNDSGPREFDILDIGGQD